MTSNCATLSWLRGLFKTLAFLWETAKMYAINVFHCKKKESLWFPFKMLESAVSDLFWTNTTWDQSSGSPRTSQVDPKSETDEEKEEGSADNLPQLLPPLQKKWGKRRGDLSPPLTATPTFSSWRPWARWSRGEGRWQFHRCVQSRCSRNQCRGNSDRRHSRSRKPRSKRLMLSSTLSSTFPQQQTEAVFSETYQMLVQGYERK